MKNILYSLCLVGAVYSLTGCSKEEPLATNNYTFNTLSEAYASIAPEEQIFTFNATTGGTVTGAEGLTLIFGPNVLQDPSGNIVSGTVTVRMIEILDVEDMVTSGVYPLDTDGKLLNSGGEFYVNITQGGTTLSIAPGSYYTIEVPSKGTDEPMDFYVGTGDTDTSFWEYYTPFLDSISGLDWGRPYYDEFNDMYTIITDVVGWMNCDALAAYGEVVMQFHLTGVDDVNADALSFYYFPDVLMTTDPLYGLWNDPENTLIDCNVYDTPGYILATTIYMGEFYYGLIHIDPEPGVTHDIPLIPATMPEFEAALEALW